MKKRLLPILLVITLIIGSIVPVAAESSGIETPTSKSSLTQNSEIIIKNQIEEAILEQGVESTDSKQVVELLIVADGKDISNSLKTIGAVVQKKSSSVYVVNIPAYKASSLSGINQIRAVGKDRILKLPRPVNLAEISMNSTIVYPNMEYSHEATDMVKFWKQGYDGRNTVVSIIDTGVEPGNELLTLTTEGKIKLIDWQDFWHHTKSDSEGDVRLQEKTVLSASGRKYVEASGRRTYLPNVQGNTVLFGYFDENLLIKDDGAGHDVNNNNKTNDTFSVAVFNFSNEDKADDVIYVDTDNDNDLSDEKAMGIYKEVVKGFRDQVIFEMGNDGKPVVLNNKPKVLPAYQTEYNKLVNHFYNYQLGTNPLGAVYNFVISTVEMRDGSWVVNLGYDGNGHGTHVAGDAAANGYRILPFMDTSVRDNQGNQLTDGTLKGAAPGTQIIACRVFQSAGGTPESAYMAAMEYSAEQGADVINMSLGSLPDINDDNSPNCALVNILSKKFGTIFTISAGNEGPSTNAVGIPGSSEWAITVGAYNPAWVNYGHSHISDGLWYFSSRGPTEDGRLKPTIIAPGSMISSVPMWYSEAIRSNRPGGGVYVGYGRMEGTSMASPYAAGTIAALKQAIEENNIPYHPLFVKEAIFETGDKTIDNSMYLPTEIGGGMIDPDLALAYMQGLKGRITQQGFMETAADRQVYIDRHDINVMTQLDYSEKLSYKPEGLYVRSGDIPNEAIVTITNTTGKALNLTLAKDSYSFGNDWLSIPQNTIALNIGESKTVALGIDKTKLNKGINSVLVRMDDMNTPLKEGFIPVTVVRYMDLTAQNSVVQESEEREFKPGSVSKHFVRIPYGTQKVEIKVKMSDGGDPSNLLPILTAPSGIQQHDVPGADWVYSLNQEATMVLNKPEPGTWEVDLFSGIIDDVARATGRHTVTATIKGIAFGPSVIKYHGASGVYKEEDVTLKLLNATPNETQVVKLEKTNLVSTDANRLEQAMTVKNGEKNTILFNISENDTNMFVRVETSQAKYLGDDLDLELHKMVTDATGEYVMGPTIAMSANSGSEEGVYLENLSPGRYAIVVEAFETAPETEYKLMYQIANSSNGENAIALRTNTLELDRTLGDVRIGLRVPAKTGKYIGFIYAKDLDGNITGKAKVEAVSEGTENNLVISGGELARGDKEFKLSVVGEIKESNRMNSMYGIQFELVYDSASVDIAEIEDGEIFKNTNIKLIEKKIENGRAIYAIGFINTAKDVDAVGAIKGTIAQIRINAKTLGKAQFKLDKLLLVNYLGDEVAINILDTKEINIVNPDLQGDSKLNIKDICLIASRLGKKAGDAGFDEDLDLNKDGLVDMKDFNFIISSFNEDI